MEQALRLAERINTYRNRTKHLPETHQSGLQGEQAAYFHLRRLGFIVVARRWTNAHTHGEIDLIAWENETLCILEVKTRDSKAAFAAEFAVDEKKQETLHRMAKAYLRQLPWKPNQQPNIQPRFDIVSVYLQPDGHHDIRLQRDAFR